VPAPLQDYSKDLSDLAALFTGQTETSVVLSRALEVLRSVIDYDLAAVLGLEGDTLEVLCCAGPLASARVRNHSISLARFPTIVRALETRQPIALEEHHHVSDEGDPYDGVLDLPHGHSCMVIPLSARSESLGVITLDRRTCGQYDEQALRIAGVYGQIASLALWFARRESLLAQRSHQLSEHNRMLLTEAGGLGEAVRRLALCHSPAMQGVVRQAQQVAESDLPVLLLGETGTGKELLAQAVHAWSGRADGPFVTLNCSAIPDKLVESELFGHVRGAFTGADAERRGRFVTANGGTLFLDEIGDMPLATQAKLLRVLQEGTFEPVGSDTPVKVDVRVVAATHVDLEQAVEDGRFRSDLFYRLAVFPLRVPTLAERAEDIEPIVRDFLAKRRRPGRAPWTIDDGAMAALAGAAWTGNVRELLNVLERATILAPDHVIDESHLALPRRRPARIGPADSGGPFPSFADNERRYLEEALARCDGKLHGKGGAAELIGMNPNTLRSKLVKHGLR